MARRVVFSPSLPGHAVDARARGVLVDEPSEVRRRIGCAHRLLVADHFVDVESAQGLLERLRPRIERLFHRFLDLRDLAVLDELGDERRVEQDLDRRLEGAVAVAHEPLRDDRAQADRKVREHTRARVVRKHVDDPRQRVVAVVRVQRGEAEVPGQRVQQRLLHRFAVADLADHDEVGRLAQCIGQRVRVVLRVDIELALIDDALLVAEQVLDRVFDGEDVARPVDVAMVDHRRQRRRLAGAGRAGDQHESPLLHDEVEQDRRAASAARTKECRCARSGRRARSCPAGGRC